MEAPEDSGVAAAWATSALRGMIHPSATGEMPGANNVRTPGGSPQGWM